MRHALAIIAAVLVLAGAVGGAYWWLDQQAGDATGDGGGPEQTVDAYLTAWERGDHDGMATLVRGADDGFVAAHDQLRDGLEVDALRTEVTDLATDVDGRATATATVSADIAALGDLRWEVTVRLLRERGAWGVAWDPAALHPQWRPGLRFEVMREDLDRRPIVDRDGAVLAGPGERVTYGFDPGDVPDSEALAVLFDRSIPGTGDTVRRLFTGGDLVDGWFYPVVSLPADEARDRTDALRGQPGVLRRTESGARSLLADAFALHLVGRVAEATAEQLEELGDGYAPGDQVGQFGLEAVLEPQLAAGTRAVAVLRDGAQGPVRTRLDPSGGEVSADEGDGDDGDGDDGDAPGIAGDAVVTTLDATVQRAVENTLLTRSDPTGFVVIDGEDGAIRASASRPLEGFDRALTGRYAPGPAIGPVLAEARAASGQDDPDGESLLTAAQRLGYGSDARLPLPAFTGSFPPPRDPSEARRAAAGQAQVEVSVLSAAAGAAAAVDGRWHPPYLLATDGPGEATDLSAGALDTLRGLLSASPDREASDASETDEELADDGPTGIVGTASGTGGTPLGWFLGTVDGLGYAVLVEDAQGAEAQRLAGRFERELAALRSAPTDLDPESVP